ncbi:transglutaminase-like domain-containing protein [Marinivivus vitaminiproducens]|uniref:transglutaminase-like domain-containing protein n=1 Tax=Marinivivus vitaminiproducens TaxID=3035935 RepID=UPI00279EB6D7|nr:transglutaminase family protein [Geminicoccaceae bacterium SCSIO 64248]
MRFSLGCRLAYQVAAPTPFLFNVEAAGFGQQRILSERLTIAGDPPYETYTQPETSNRLVRLIAQPGALTLSYDAEVELDAYVAEPASVDAIPAEQLPFAVLPHLNPSRFCPSDKLAAFAHAEFDGPESGHERVARICNWIYERTKYRPGSSDAMTSAIDTMIDRAGVCRDFAHLGVTLCRALGIPARFVSCYAWQLDPPDFHAVFEAYLGGRWYLFDPTRQASLDGLVRIGCGRDAADVSFATIHGQVEPTDMQVRIRAHDEKATLDHRTAMAVSTSAE